MNVRIFAILTIFAAYFGYYTYERGGWDFILSLQILWFACFGAGIYLSKLLRDRLAKNGEPAFPLIIIFIVSFFLVGLSEAPISTPMSDGFDFEGWHQNPLLVLFGWFGWNFSMGAFVFALVGPNKTLEEGDAKDARID